MDRLECHMVRMYCHMVRMKGHVVRMECHMVRMKCHMARMNCHMVRMECRRGWGVLTHDEVMLAYGWGVRKHMVRLCWHMAGVCLNRTRPGWLYWTVGPVLSDRLFLFPP